MRLSTWLTALLLILAVSAVGLATTAAAAGPHADAAKKKGCKKGYVKKKTAKGSKCVKKKAAKKKTAPKPVTGNPKLPADGQYTLSGVDVYISGKQTSILIRATIPTTEMHCQSGTPSRSSGLVSLTLPLASNGTFNGSSTLNGPADASGQFSDATHLSLTVTARDVQGGNSAADLCNGTKSFVGTLTKK